MFPINSLFPGGGGDLMGIGQMLVQDPERTTQMLAMAGVEPPTPEAIRPSSYNPFSPPENSGLGRRDTSQLPVMRPSVPITQAPPGAVPMLGQGEMPAPQPGTPLPPMGGPGAYEGTDSPFAPPPQNVPLPVPRPAMPMQGVQQPTDMSSSGVPLPRPRPEEAGAGEGQQPGGELQKMAKALAGVKMPEAPGIQRISSPPPPRPAAINTSQNTNIIQSALAKPEVLTLLRLAQAIGGK